jgi:4-hydroxy-3-methylbut-2-enyl diphosphate reductase
VTTISNGRATALETPRIPVQRPRLENRPSPANKRLLLAAPRGYCAGVDRAVIAVEKALDNYGAPVYVRKQIVHNIHVVSTLEKKGAIFVDDVEEVPVGSHVVFSAHGVSPAVVKSAADRELLAIDATCPLVTKVHREATRFARDDFEILLIGHAGHEEVEGTMGHAPERTTLVNSPADVPNVVVRNPDHLVWLSQTTLSVDETMETVRLLRERFPNLQDPPSDDICYATQNRQVAIKKVAQDAELVIVVGSANSSNTVRLVDVALENGAKAAYRVDYASEIKQEWLDGVATVGVTSGASVPEVLVQEVLDDLADAGYADVSQVVTAEEDLMFSLPKELRTDAAGNPDERGLGGRVKRLDWQRDAAPVETSAAQHSAAQHSAVQHSPAQQHPTKQQHSPAHRSGDA